MRPARLVLDLGFGDAGKGATVDHLVRREGADWVIRHHGGAQAGHNVVTTDGRHHTFSQLGAGSFVPGVRTLLADAFVLHPGALRFELDHLGDCGVGDALERVFVDGRARVITPVHQAALHLRELARGGGAHGTTGVGIDPCVRDAMAGHDDVLHARDVGRDVRFKLQRQQERWREELAPLRGLADPRAALAWAVLDEPELAMRVMDFWAPLTALNRLEPDQAQACIERAEAPLFEGAQGILLDEVWGFHPHTTWGDCTPGSARRLIGGRDLHITALTRTSTCRHGAGPLPAQMDPPQHIHEPHNGDEGWQGAFRFGALDLVLLRYAAQVCGPIDRIALNHCDQVRPSWPVVPSYDLDGTSVDHLDPGPGAFDDLSERAHLAARLGRARPRIVHMDLPALRTAVEDAVEAPIAVEGWGPRSEDRRWRA